MLQHKISSLSLPRQYILRSLDLTAWEQFFQSRNLSTDMLDFAALHNAYGGNAKAMDIIRSAILEDYAGDVAAYWQANQHDLFIERDLEDLVTQQFDRLQQIDLDAYNLLCRMGCYRYQDVPTVPIEGLLCLLWDVPENRQRRVVKSLQDRSLMEFANSEYWLHPVIRGEAINRLRNSEIWGRTNQALAEFWTLKVETIETDDDALEALEAYFHYLEIRNTDLAVNVLLKMRRSKWRTKSEAGEFLVSSFNRLGLLQPILFAVDNIVNNIKTDCELGIIIKLRGDLYGTLGDIHKAIKCYSQAEKILDRCLDAAVGKQSEQTMMTLVKRLKFSSLIGKGVCKIDLYELREAINFFDSVASLPQSEVWHRYQITSWFCLAFLNSCLGFTDKAIQFAEKTLKLISTDDLSLWGKGYSLLFLGLTYKNLRQFEDAFSMYAQALQYGENINYKQIVARAIIGEAELYREKEEFDQAFSKHLKAIDLLTTMSAKSDLAEAYYQLGLTYQAIGKSKESNERFQEAIQLFSKMEAPKQVERVRRSMNNPEQLD